MRCGGNGGDRLDSFRPAVRPRERRIRLDARRRFEADEIREAAVRLLGWRACMTHEDRGVGWRGKAAGATVRDPPIRNLTRDRRSRIAVSPLWRVVSLAAFAQASAPSAKPAIAQKKLCERRLVSRNFASWNRIDVWLRQLDGIRHAA